MRGLTITLLIIFSIILCLGVYYFYFDINSKLSKECIVKIKAFDKNPNSEDFIAQITNVSIEHSGGNSGSYNILEISLKGFTARNTTSIILNSYKGGNVFLGGRTCKNISDCKEYIINQTSFYKNNNCSCSSDLINFSYSCICRDYTYSEIFRYYEPNINNSRFVSSEQTKLNLVLDNSNIGKYIRVSNKRDIPGNDYRAFEFVDCVKY